MSLTDDWKDSAIACGTWYWVKLDNLPPQPMAVDCDGWLVSLDNSYSPNSDLHSIEILAICDYDNFVGLNEKVKELDQDVKTLTNNYKLLEEKQAGDIAQGQALVDEFGDFKALHEELIGLRKEVDKGDGIIGKLLNEGDRFRTKNRQLRQLLEECLPYINANIDIQMSVGHYPQLEYDLLTRVNEVLGNEIQATQADDTKIQDEVLK